MNPDLAASPESAGSPVVAVSGNPWVAGSLAVASGATALGYAGRAQSSGSPLLPSLVALAFALLALVWVLATLDARLPRLVMDRHGVRLRFVRNWVGIPWADFGEVTIRTHRGWWRDDVIAPIGAALHGEPAGRLARWQAAWTRRCFGSAYAVPVGWTTRIYGADGDLSAAIRRLQSAPDVTTPSAEPAVPRDLPERRLDLVPGPSRPHVAGTLRARLRDPRPTIAAGITLGANALALHPTQRRVGLPESDQLHRTEPDLVELADPTTEATHVIALPSEHAPPGADREIGSTLANARLRLALTVPQLAERARIPVRVIEAIESGDFSTSGGDFHARGQLRTLCRVLGVDVAPLLTAYDTEPVGPHPVGREALVATLAQHGLASTEVRTRRCSLAAAAVLVVALGWSLALLDQPTRPALEPPGAPAAPVQP